MAALTDYALVNVAEYRGQANLSEELPDLKLYFSMLGRCC